MSSGPTSAGGPLQAALERWAQGSPEAPFLFFRGERGHFRWWSFAAALAELDRTSTTRTSADTEPRAFLLGLEALRSAPSEQLGRQLGAPRRGRDIWISTRAVDVTCEAQLALWAAHTGAAIVREPGERLHPELLAWARPTLVSAPAAELDGLFGGLESISPRLWAKRWRRRRLARLRALLVEGPGETLALARRMAALGAPEDLSLLPFPGARW